MPYKSGQPYDDGFKFVIAAAKKAITEKNDDFLVMGVGFTGTGKSNQLLHGYELFAEEEATVEQIALTRKDFASSLKRAKESQTVRFVGYDEANVNKRDALTKWNKQVLDLYWSIRGLRIFHWWCNPSLDFIDKPFIEERIKGVFFVFTKDVKRPRLYYYFRKKDILALYEKTGDLKLKTLKKHGKKYAYYRGWFRPYTGRLLQEYLAKKESRMEEKIEEFFNDYGDNNYNLTDAGKILGVGAPTVKKWCKLGQQQHLTDGIVINASGTFRIQGETGIATLRTLAEITGNNRKEKAKINCSKINKSKNVVFSSRAEQNNDTGEADGAV